MAMVYANLFASNGKSRQIALKATAMALIGRPQPTQDNRKALMAQAVMDPEQVRRFAEELKRFNADLQNRLAALQARFAALGDSWQDQEHIKFSDEFKETLKALKRFMEVSNQHTPYLLRKAQRIEEYLNQR